MKREHADGIRWCTTHQWPIDPVCWCGSVHAPVPVECCYDCPFDGLAVRATVGGGR